MSHWKKIIAGGFGAVFLTGCATMLPHYRLSDNYTQALGVQVAVFETCANNGYWDRGLSYQNGYAVTELLDTAVADKSFFERGYNGAMQQGRGMSPRQIKDKCDEIEPYISSLSSRVGNNYKKAVETRAMGVQSFNDSLSEFNQSMQAFNSSMAKSNANMLSINESRNSALPEDDNPDHYLISTSKGDFQCTKFSSGYVRCY